VVNAPKKSFSPLPAGRYTKSTKRSTQQRHLANEGKSGFDGERVREWIEEYVEGETARARKRVADAEAAVQLEEDDLKHAEIEGLTYTEPEQTFEEMMVAIGDSLSDLASSDDGEDGEDEDEEEIEQGKLSEDDEPGCVMGTITKTVQQCLESFRQKQMKLDKLTQPRWGDAANYFREQDKKYGTFELRVPAVVQAQTNDDTPAPPPTTWDEQMECVEIAPGISLRPRGTSRPGTSHIRLGSVKPQSRLSIPSGEPAAEPNWSKLLKAKPVEPVPSVEPVCIYRCI